MHYEFDFKEYKASEGRYAIHEYPAMFHYKVVNKLIQDYSSPDNTIYDPFCGSGVAIVEGLKLGRYPIGTDINPIALLITDVRSSNINVDNADQYWFKEYVINDLGKLRQFIKTIKDDKLFKFFLVVLSQTVRQVSNNKKGEFKRYRLNEEKLKHFHPNSLNTFLNNAYKYLTIIKQEPLPSNHYSLFLHDIRKEISISNVDLVITSPPYGDSKTTVAYGQFSIFSVEWLRGLNPYGDTNVKLDTLCLGGQRTKERILLPSHTLHAILNQINTVDHKRSLEVYSFFYDYYLSIKNISQTLNNNATVCFIVGNRTVRGVNIRMDLITAEFFESCGLRLENIFVRNIFNKRMPYKNSPSNKVGQTSNTMQHEYIVIMKKSLQR